MNPDKELQGELQTSMQEPEKIREELIFTKFRSLIICPIHKIYLRWSNKTWRHVCDIARIGNTKNAYKISACEKKIGYRFWEI